MVPTPPNSSDPSIGDLAGLVQAFIAVLPYAQALGKSTWDKIWKKSDSDQRKEIQQAWASARTETEQRYPGGSQASVRIILDWIEQSDQGHRFVTDLFRSLFAGRHALESFLRETLDDTRFRAVLGQAAGTAVLRIKRALFIEVVVEAIDQLRWFLTTSQLASNSPELAGLYWTRNRDTAIAEGTLAHYLEAFKRFHNHLDFIGIPVREDRQEPTTLDQVFVSLEALEVFSLAGERFGRDEELENDSTSEEVATNFERTSRKLVEVLSEGLVKRSYKGSVVIGGPGFGKSTALRAICLQNAALETTGEWDVVPIFVSLSEFAKARSSGVTLERYMALAARAELNCSLDDHFFEFLLQRNACLVCLDGLDEMFVDTDRRAIRQVVESFAAMYPLAHVIVSSRPIGYPAVALPFDQFRHFQVLPLDDRLIRQFLERWFKQREPDALTGKQMADHLMTQIESRPTVHDLARVPLLLTLIALIFRVETSLPDERVILFEKATDTLLLKWQASKEGGESNPRRALMQERSQPYFRRLRYLVQRLALEVHTGASPRRLRRLSESELEQVLLRLLMQDPLLEYANDASGAAEQAQRMIKLLLHATGLLVSDGHGSYSFPHLTFQEFLAAAALADEYIAEPEKLFNALQPHLFQPHWHEVVLLTLSRLGSRNEQAVQTVLELIFNQADLDPLERMYGHHLRLLVEAVSDLVPISERLWIRLKGKIELAMESGFDEEQWRKLEEERSERFTAEFGESVDVNPPEFAAAIPESAANVDGQEANVDKLTSAEFIWEAVSRLGFHPTFGQQVIALLERVYDYKSSSFAASALIVHRPVRADLYKNAAESGRWLGEEGVMAVPRQLQLGDLLQIVQTEDHPIRLQSALALAGKSELEGDLLENTWQSLVGFADPFHCYSFATTRLSLDPEWSTGLAYLGRIVSEPRNPSFHYTVIHAAIWLLERDGTRADCLDALEGLAARPGHPDCIQAISVLLEHQPDRSDLLELLTWIVEFRPPVAYTGENGRCTAR
jgi:hypothetical protein